MYAFTKAVIIGWGLFVVAGFFYGVHEKTLAQGGGTDVILTLFAVVILWAVVAVPMAIVGMLFKH